MIFFSPHNNSPTGINSQIILWFSQVIFDLVWWSCGDHAVSGCSRCNVLSFCLCGDLILGDNEGFFLLVNLGYILIKLRRGWWWHGLGKHSVTSNEMQNRLTAGFSVAPPNSLQPRPLSEWSDTDTSSSPSSPLTRPKSGFSTSVLPDMSLGHLLAKGVGAVLCLPLNFVTKKGDPRQNEAWPSLSTSGPNS